MTDVDEIVKSGAVDKAADLLHKLAGPVFEEFGAMLGDKVRVYRGRAFGAVVKRWARRLALEVASDRASDRARASEVKKWVRRNLGYQGRGWRL
jgi:hypothetical protein